MKTTLRSSEFSCPSCVAKIEGALEAIDGVERAKVHFNSGRIEVEHDPGEVSPEMLTDAVRSAGYQASVSSY